MEKRHNYVRKVAETAVEMFIKNDKVSVAGLILAGSADFKTELGQSDMFDQVTKCGFFVKRILTTFGF
jgi:peptide chain release factor subunit 1